MRKYVTNGVHILPGLLTAAMLCLAAGAAGAADRSGVITLEVDLSAQAATGQTRLWIPYPVSDRNQLVTAVQVSGDYDTSGVYTDRVSGTPILYAEWPAGRASRKLAFSFAVNRHEVTRRAIPATEPAWNPADHADYLGATSLGPLNSQVMELAGKITAGKRSTAERAKAIYDWTVENMYRDPDTKGCGRGDVCALLARPGGKCTDISSVFIVLCRAAGVPSREVFGLRLGKKAAEEITTWQHCWAEVFLPGYGWLSVDPADVRKAMLVEKLELDNPRTKEYRDYFWGNLDPYRVALATGRDLVLNPPQDAPPLNTFGYPYAEVGGTPVDFYEPKTFTYRYLYQERP
jgi:transglutaminase-like putative cysteine protease